MRALRVLPLLLLALAAHAQVPPAGTVPAGRGTLRFWGFPIYDAQLWVAPGFRASEFAAYPLALELSYRLSIKASDTARRTLQEMARTGPVPADQGRRWEEQLQAVLPDVSDGDRLAGVNRPGHGVVFFHNGKRIGEIADAEFARRFFAIWLGPATSEPGLRESLLAGTTP